MSKDLQKFVPQAIGKGFTFHGKISPTGWEPDGDLSYEQWEQDGQIFQCIDGSLNWIIGDWLNYGERKYGETYAQAIEWTGHKIDRLQVAKWVSGAVKCSMRIEHLSFTHHRHIAHLPDAEQREWLAAAVANGWSSRELLQALEQANAKRKAPPQPQWTKEEEEELPFTDLPEEEDPPYTNDYMYELPSAIPEVTKPHVAYNSGNNEWYTPGEYIAAAKEVLGAIDLDPASSVEANRVVGALDFFTAEDNGLNQEWIGKVWLNPPYESSLIGEFIKKLCCHYKAGNVTEAIVLVNNATETGWFQALAECSSVVCFPRSRVRFWQPNGDRGAPLQGQAILYIGENRSGFSASFGRFGFIAKLK